MGDLLLSGASCSYYERKQGKIKDNNGGGSGRALAAGLISHQSEGTGWGTSSLSQGLLPLPAALTRSLPLLLLQATKGHGFMVTW
jgi:hypothetical protein